MSAILNVPMLVPRNDNTQIREAVQIFPLPFPFSPRLVR